jgi:ribosome maturation factor RimP
MTTGIERLRDMAVPMVAARGFVLYDIERQGPVVRITVTGEPAPGIADLAAITRELSRELDETDPLEGGYTLEVSSPGLERTLRTPEHYQSAIGEVASIRVRSSEGSQRVRGVVLRADADQVVLEVDDDAAPELAIPYDTIDKARTVFEWGMVAPVSTPSESDSTKPATRRSDR